MQIRIVVVILLLALAVPFVAAQDVVYELAPVTDSVTATFEADVTTQLYAFTALAGDSITLSMTQADGSILDPYLVLVDSTGAVLATDDDSGAVAYAALISDFEIPDDGNYFVMASSLLFLDGTELSTDDPLDYELLLLGATQDTNDAEALIPLEATPLVYGDEVSGESLLEAPAVFYLFDGAAGDQVSIMTESGDFFTILHLFDPTGARIATDPSAIELELADDGTYLILVTDVFFFEALLEDGFYTGGAFSLQLNQQ